MSSHHPPARDLADQQASADLRERVTSTAERLSAEVAGFLDVLSTQADEAAAVEAALRAGPARKKVKRK